MSNIKGKLVDVIVLTILAIGALIRISAYGDLSLSIGNMDTYSYISSSRSPLLSWNTFAGTRLLTTNLVYKLANDEQKCNLPTISLPNLGEEQNRQVQPCFDTIALLQNILAIIGWCYLAWTTSRWLKTPFAKIAAAILILTFGFTPQIAGWDSVLGPETLTLSLLVLSFAVLQEIVFRVTEGGANINSRKIVLLALGWSIIYTLWVFVRDVHLYTVLISLALTAPLLLIKEFRASKAVLTTVAILIGVFVLGYFSAKDSQRATHYPLVHAFNDFILPFPKRLDFFKKFGMPDVASPAFEKWFDDNASSVYGLFLLSHPRFVADTLIESPYFLSSNFLQPYFPFAHSQLINDLINIGELVHPESNSIYLIDTLMLLGLFIAAIRSREPSLIAWSWLGLWLFLVAFVTLILTFFGDTAGTRRHIYPSIETFRLFTWIFLAVFIDRLSANQAKKLV